MARELPDKYHEFRRTQTGIDKLRTEATKLASNVFSEAELEQATAHYVQYASAIIARTPHFRDATLSATGNDVRVPNIDLVADYNMVGFKVNAEHPRRPLGNLINIDGVFHCITVERSDTDDGIQLNPIMYIARKLPQFNVPVIDGRPFTQFSRTDYAMVPLDERTDSRLSLKLLDLLQDKKEAFIELSLAGLTRDTFTRGLKSLNKAFTEEEEDFTPLKNISALRNVGRQGKILTEARPHLDNAVTSSTLRTLGAGKVVVIESEIVHNVTPEQPIYSYTGKVDGHILDVCSDLYGISSDSLILVVKPNSGDSLNYVPLDTVTSYWF